MPTLNNVKDFFNTKRTISPKTVDNDTGHVERGLASNCWAAAGRWKMAEAAERVRAVLCS
eukprot:6324389-Prymnesium_polylepis.2